MLSFWVGAAGRGVARKVRDTGRPARANKEKNSVSGGAGRGVARRLGGAGKPARPILAA